MLDKFFNWSENSKGRNEITLKYEPIQPYLLLSFIKFARSEVFLDLGANIGLYSIFASVCDSLESIVAFEPESHAFNELQRNVDINGLSNLIDTRRSLISDENSKRKFGVHSPLSGINGVLDSTIHKKDLYRQAEDINSVTLDSLYSYCDKPIAMKIDVEGHELHVLKGASRLLKENPVIVQIEHYIGGRIDKFLESCGYFCIHSAGHDYYYSNITNFNSTKFVNRAIRYAHSMLIDCQTGVFKNDNLLSQSLSVDIKIENKKIAAHASLDSKKFFKRQVEYAFYLLVNGKKYATVWYSESNSVEFDLPTTHHDCSLKAFAREKSNNEKITSTEVYIDQSKRERQGAKASLPESFNAPLSILDSCNSNLNKPYELNFEELINWLECNKYNRLVLIGGKIDTILPVSLIHNLSKQSIFISSAKSHHRPQHMVSKHVTFKSKKELIDKLEGFGSSKSKINCFIIFDELFNYLELSELLVKEIFSAAGPDDILVCQELTNQSYRDIFTKYAREKNHQLLLLKPKSNVCINDGDSLKEIKYKGSAEVTSKLDFKL